MTQARMLCLAAAALTGVASAQPTTITVTTVEDVVDAGYPISIGDLPGPDGMVSFHEALYASEGTPGIETIEFAIPAGQFNAGFGVFLLALENAFVVYDDDLTIDFSSQERTIGDMNPDAPDVGIYGYQVNGWGSPAIMLFADRCTIRGLGTVWQRGSSVAVWEGNDNRIVGCKTGTIEIDGSFGGPPVTGNIVGGTEPGDANDLETVEILCWSDNNVVIGNTIEHVRVEGSQYCVYPTGNRIGGPTPAERNVIAGWGSYGEEGFPDGVLVSVVWAQDTIVEGNYIGTTPDGMAREPQIAPTGVRVADSIGTIVRNNLIAGLRTNGGGHYSGQVFGEAISISGINGDDVGTSVSGNTIGLAADGVTPIPTRSGITVAPFTARRTVRDARIGGVEPGQGNIVALTDAWGIGVHSLVQGVTISGNSIYGNGLLGIDLNINGVSGNDPSDGDTGGNNLQNFPVLIEASTSATATIVGGVLASIPGETYRIEVFASPECDPSGFGEGREFLGWFEVSTDGAGQGAFDAAVAPSTAGWSLTATATRLSTGDTSEFSACVALVGGCPADIDGDGDADRDDFFAYLDLFATGDAAADLDSDGDHDADDFFAYLDLFAAGC